MNGNSKRGRVLFDEDDVGCLGEDELAGMEENLALHSGSPCSRCGFDGGCRKML